VQRFGKSKKGFTVKGKNTPGVNSPTRRASSLPGDGLGIEDNRTERVTYTQVLLDRGSSGLTQRAHKLLAQNLGSIKDLP